MTKAVFRIWVCEFCGKHFEPSHSQVCCFNHGRSKHKFCSCKCAGASRRKYDGSTSKEREAQRRRRARLRAKGFSAANKPLTKKGRKQQRAQAIRIRLPGDPILVKAPKDPKVENKTA